MRVVAFEREEPFLERGGHAATREQLEENLLELLDVGVRLAKRAEAEVDDGDHGIKVAEVDAYVVGGKVIVFDSHRVECRENASELSCDLGFLLGGQGERLQVLPQRWAAIFGDQ